MALTISKEVLVTTLAKSVSSNPVNALVRPPWATVQTSKAFGSTEVFFIVRPDGTIDGECNIRTETPGEVNIVIRESDKAIAFVRKYRNQVLPRSEANIAWRNTGNLDLLSAPQLGMDTLELTRGWTYNPEKPWKLMTEGQEETGLVVTGITSIGHIYPNTGVISTWADLSFGIASNKLYGKPVDKLEASEIKKVVWLTPSEVREYIADESCGFSIAALNKFRVYALNSQNEFLRELGQQL
jgi:hypothetical protein